MKIENPEVLVGLQIRKFDDAVDMSELRCRSLEPGIHFAIITRSSEAIAEGSPKLPHAFSNCTHKQLKSYVKSRRRETTIDPI